MTPRTVSSTRTEMVQIMQPGDANFLGKVFGGHVLAQVDLCAYTTASRFSGEVCVTASFDRVDFHYPIEVGDVVTFCGLVTYVGRTSVEVTIEVFSENIFTRERHQTNTARVTMVAVRDGKPVQVPRLVCETREDKIRFLQGKLRRELRTSYQHERERRFEEIAALPDQDLERMMSESA